MNFRSMRSPCACQKISAALIWLVLAAAPAAGEPLGGGERAIVSDVIDGDTVVLDRALAGAREVRLVGIQAPKLPLGRRDFREWPLAPEAKAALERLIAGRTVNLSYGGQRMDRHGRLLAHLHRDDGTWVQGAMLSAGMARVYSFADNRARVGEMLAIEGRARAARAGIWGHPFYALRTPDSAAQHIDAFEIVEGRVRDVAVVRGRAYMNFGADWRTDFTVTLSPKTARMFARDGHDPESYEGRLVRVRGWLQSYNGPLIEATHPEQIEVLDE